MNMIVLLGQDWGSMEKAVPILRRLRYLGCIMIHVVYAAFADRGNHFSQRLAMNATVVYDFAYRLIMTGFGDESHSPYFCPFHRPNMSYEELCYPKTVLMHGTNYTLPCLRETLNDTIPMYVDTALYAYSTVYKVARTHGFLNYLISG